METDTVLLIFISWKLIQCHFLSMTLPKSKTIGSTCVSKVLTGCECVRAHYLSKLQMHVSFALAIPRLLLYPTDTLVNT